AAAPLRRPQFWGRSSQPLEDVGIHPLLLRGRCGLVVHTVVQEQECVLAHALRPPLPFFVDTTNRLPSIRQGTGGFTFRAGGHPPAGTCASPRSWASTG